MSSDDWLAAEEDDVTEHEDIMSTETQTDEEERDSTIEWVSIGDLEIDPENIRGETFNRNREEDANLIESIKTQGGVHTSLMIRPAPEDSDADYWVFAGSRRYWASLEAGLDEVPCIVHDVDDVTAAGLSVSENRDRKNVPAWNEAFAVIKHDRKLTFDKSSQKAEHLAEKFGCDTSTIYNYRNLGKLAGETKFLVKDPSEWSQNLTDAVKVQTSVGFEIPDNGLSIQKASAIGSKLGDSDRTIDDILAFAAESITKDHNEVREKAERFAQNDSISIEEAWDDYLKGDYYSNLPLDAPFKDRIIEIRDANTDDEKLEFIVQHLRDEYTAEELDSDKREWAREISHEVGVHPNIMNSAIGTFLLDARRSTENEPTDTDEPDEWVEDMAEDEPTEQPPEDTQTVGDATESGPKDERVSNPPEEPEPVEKTDGWPEGMEPPEEQETLKSPAEVQEAITETDVSGFNDELGDEIEDVEDMLLPGGEEIGSDIENLEEETTQLLDELDDGIADAQKKRSEELLNAWLAHHNALSQAHNLRCPVCGDSHIEYSCHGFSLKESYELSRIAFRDHVRGDPELHETEYADEESDWRDFDGKEEAPSFEEIIEGRNPHKPEDGETA